MTDQPQPDDIQTIDLDHAPTDAQTPGADETLQAAPITDKRKSRLGLYGALAIVVAIGGGYAFTYLDGEELLHSRFISTPRSLDTTAAGAELAASASYRESLSQVNNEGAAAALVTTGQSFMAVPDQPVEPALKDIDDRPRAVTVKPPSLPAANKEVAAVTEPVEPVVEVKTIEKEVPVYYEYQRTNTEVQNDYADIDALSRAMMNQAGGLTGWEAGASRNEIIIQQDLYQDPTGRSVGVDAGATRAPAPSALRGSTQPALPSLPDQRSSIELDGGSYGADLEVGLRGLRPNPRLDLPVRTGAMPYGYNPYGYGTYGEQLRPTSVLAKAGSVAYARIINGTDSDTPGPIIAEVRSGDLKGARLIGSFTTNREVTNMIISFDQVVLEDATIIPTSAYAVDAIYGDLAVRSNYDGRYLQRYAPRLAGAFVRGAGEALAQTQTTIVGLSQGAVGVAAAEPSLRESLAAGASDFGNQIASELENLGPDEGLVQLYANKPVGVLFLANVDRPTR